MKCEIIVKSSFLKTWTLQVGFSTYTDFMNPAPSTLLKFFALIKHLKSFEWKSQPSSRHSPKFLTSDPRSLLNLARYSIWQFHYTNDRPSILEKPATWGTTLPYVFLDPNPPWSSVPPPLGFIHGWFPQRPIVQGRVKGGKIGRDGKGKKESHRKKE